MEEAMEYNVVPYSEKANMPEKYQDIDTNLVYATMQNERLGMINLARKVSAIKEDIGYLQNDKKGSLGKGITYGYVSSEKIRRTIIPLLKKYKVSFEIESYPDPTLTDKGVWFLAIATAIDLETGYKDVKKYSFPMDDNPANSSIRNYGSSVSYASRYIYKQFFDIATGDDEDTDSSNAVLVDKDVINWIASSFLPYCITLRSTLTEHGITLDQLTSISYSILTGVIEKDVVLKRWKDKGINVDILINKKED